MRKIDAAYMDVEHTLLCKFWRQSNPRLLSGYVLLLINIIIAIIVIIGILLLLFLSAQAER